MNYSEKLKDPRWQKKRLEKFEANGWECEICSNSKETLHLHHKEYRKCEPWEYDYKELMCVCEWCHGRLHEGFNIEQIKYLKVSDNSNNKYRDLFYSTMRKLIHSELIENNLSTEKEKIELAKIIIDVFLKEEQNSQDL